MSKDSVVAGGLTQSQINGLKAQSPNKKVTLITLEAYDDKPKKHFWFKAPDMNIMSAVAKVGSKDPLKGTEILFKNCLLEGDKEAYKDTDQFMNLAPELDRLIEERQATIKKF